MHTLRDLVRKLYTGDGRGHGLWKVRVFVTWALFVGSIIAAIGGLAADADRLRFIALNLILGGAAGFAGGLIGFIFGIPRSFSDGHAAMVAARHQADRKSEPNTNLEQISDWLTKVLIGVSLASVTALPHFIVKTIQFLDRGPYNGLTGGGTLAIFIIVYFALLGFFCSYIETRTFLTKLLEDSEEGEKNQTAGRPRLPKPAAEAVVHPVALPGPQTEPAPAPAE